MSKQKQNTCVESMPEELIEEILLKLPKKLLLRFKIVSRKWFALITSHRFAHRYYLLTKAENIASFILWASSWYLKSLNMAITARLEYSVLKESYIAFRIGTNPRVVVSAGYGIYCVLDTYEWCVWLWNPGTGECTELPPPPERRFGHSKVMFGDNKVFCFGRVDYKDGNLSYMVCLVVPKSHLCVNLKDLDASEVYSVVYYSSETRSWRVISDCGLGEFYYYHSDQGCINLNGKAHLMMGSTHITTFDYETKAIGKIEIQLAPKVGTMWKTILSVWDEAFLCVVRHWEKDDKWFVDIWVMREYEDENSWTKEYTLGSLPQRAQVLGFSSRIHSLLLRLHCGPYIILYDCRTSGITIFSLPSKHTDYHFQIAEHEESIFSVSK